jgi:TetR/AcrR family transcriptional regulator of autoinduction and epiphytic fitness
LSVKKPPKRTYNSSRRKEQAKQTRLLIVEAARNLFIERGYAGATLEAIAQKAGVAVETVYAAFGNKRAILSKLINISLVGDDEPVPLLQRQGPQAVMQKNDQRLQIELFANDIYEIMSRVAPIFDIMRVAAKTEPDISEMLQGLLDARVQGMMAFIKAVMSNGPLREKITPEDAAETVWTITSGEVYTLLITNRGWSGDKYKQWLTDTLLKLILP